MIEEWIIDFQFYLKKTIRTVISSITLSFYFHNLIDSLTILIHAAFPSSYT